MPIVRPFDTTADAWRIQTGLNRGRAPAERVVTAMRMSDDARAITEAGIRSRHRDWSDAQVRRELLSRIYGRDLVDRAWGRSQATGRPAGATTPPATAREPTPRGGSCR